MVLCQWLFSGSVKLTDEKADVLCAEISASDGEGLRFRSGRIVRGCAVETQPVCEGNKNQRSRFGWLRGGHMMIWARRELTPGRGVRGVKADRRDLERCTISVLYDGVTLWQR